nr:GHKL domain-containing protein [Fredinandcohnia sp. SECRCQ15]
MEAVDQIKLIANLLDNAIDAALDFKSSSPRITVITHKYGGIYILEISNHAQFEDTKVLDNLFGKYDISSKSGNHEGLGTFIIANLVKKYNGKLTYQYRASVLTIRIKLPIIVKEG